MRSALSHYPAKALAVPPSPNAQVCSARYDVRVRDPSSKRNLKVIGLQKLFDVRSLAIAEYALSEICAPILKDGKLHAAS
jgi:hypothetical protein